MQLIYNNPDEVYTFEKQQARSAKEGSFYFQEDHIYRDRKLGGLLGSLVIESVGTEQSDTHIFLPSVAKETFINVSISRKKYGRASQFFIFI